MKKAKIFISILLVLTVIFSAAAPAAFAVDTPEKTETVTDAPAEKEEYVWSSNPIKNKIYRDGIATATTKDFFNLFKGIRKAIDIVTGKLLTGSDENLNISVDSNLTELCAYISENSCLDINMILQNVPDWNDPARLIGKTMKIDVTEYRTEMYEKEQLCYEKGQKVMGTMCHFIGAYMSVIDHVDIYLEKWGDEPDVYQVNCCVYYGDGYGETFHPGILINTATGDCYGKEDGGMVNIGFNTNAYEMLVYAPMYCWMRDFGFCIEYDLLCYALPIYCYNTRRFKFNYQNNDWMIQIWKGNYLITNGGEVGVYYRDEGKIGSFYKCVPDELRLPMSLQVYHGYDLLVNIPETEHWWVNGFNMGNRLYSPHSLTMKFTIDFKDEEMKNAFVKSVGNNIYKDVIVTEDEASDTKVNCVWAK